MTLSVIARSQDGRSMGVVCATGGPAVGAFVPHCRRGIGAVITQGFSTSLPAAEFALHSLSLGVSVEAIVVALQQRDPGAAWRQFAVMDWQGQSAGWTGSENVASCGLYREQGLLVAGNMLSNDEVVLAMVHGFHAQSHDLPLSERLLQALLAGHAHGGDRRGHYSAALLVYDEDQPPLSLRIDWAKDAVQALLELYQSYLLNLEFQQFLQRIPTDSLPFKY